MNKINEILVNILATFQVLVNNILTLLFQPFFTVTSIIQGVYEIWSNETEYTNNSEAEKTNNSPVVMQYPSTNEGKFAEECDYPIGEHHIGFRINTDEQQQIDEIRKQLNNQ